MEFSIYEMNITNQELNITYTPKSSVRKYSYEIYKDNEYYQKLDVNDNKESIIKLDKTGSYQIKVTNYVNNKKEYVESGIYNIDLESPVITEDNISVYKLKKGEEYSISELNIRAYDEVEGNLTSNLECDFDDIDFNSLGIQKLTCKVSDSAGNETIKSININVLENPTNYLILIQIFFLVILVLIAYSLLKYQKNQRYEKRIIPYTLEPVKEKNKTLSNNFLLSYHQFLVKFGKILKKSFYINKHSQKFDKYTSLYDGAYKEGIEFISEKIIFGIIFIIIAFFSKMLFYKVLTLDEMLFIFIIGYFLPNFIYVIRYKIYRNKLENDLFQAVIVMNNAFKSGRSITQAIDLVANELDGPIALEFKRMSMELSFGLEIETVFERLSERIKLEEVTYLTASLAILNKTGGNIIKVFTDIETNLFNKKKLKVELKSLTGTSKIVVTVLYLVPIAFVVFINIASPGYFEAFYTTTLGIIFMAIIFILYVIYIFIVRKIMKVRM